MENLLNSTWAVTIIGGVIVGIILYHVFGIGKKEKGGDHSVNRGTSSALSAGGNISAGRDIVIGGEPAHEGYKIPNTTSRKQKRRALVNVTPKYLIGLFDSQTSIQAQKLADSFIGKWIKISGPMGDVSVFNGYFSQVTFEYNPSDYIPIYMYFGKRKYAEDRLSVLKKGDKITVLGQIKEITRATLSLHNCELLDSE